MAVIKVLDVNEFARGLKPVTSTQMKLRTGEFDENGLFSEVLFGPEGSIDRSMRMSFIELNAEVIHPSLYRIVLRLDRRLEKMFFAETSFALDATGKLIESEEGETGILGFKNLMNRLKFRGETAQREELIKLINFNYKKGTLFIDKLPVIPPEFRPYFEDEQTGEITYDELNELYVDILRKSFQIKSINKTTAFYSVLNANLQKAVNIHDAFILKKIEKKRGLLRNNILGKRVDFSGRAVITSGPQLGAHEIGIPLKMAVQIFSPFLIHLLIFSPQYPRREELRKEISEYTEGGELSVDTLQKLFRSIESGDKIPGKLNDIIFEAAEIVSRKRLVLAKRDPVIHELSYRAFKVKIVPGETIHLSALHTGGFNADYDGDQMAIYHPLTNQAQEEIRQKMLRSTGTKNFNSVIYELSKDMLVGIYSITKPKSENNSPYEVSEEELEKATNPYIAVIYRGKKTTMGKAIVNSAFPKDFPFIDDTINKKIIGGLIQKLLKNYGQEIADAAISKLKTIGFKFATIMGPSLDISNIEMPAEIDRIKQRIRTASPEEAFKLLEQANEIMKKRLENTGVYDLSASGATKGWDQLQQMFIAKGVISDTEGKILDPIAGSYADGLTPKEFFVVGAGARKGVVDRALNTADTGYFTRQLVYVLNSVEAHPSLVDCKTKRTITIRVAKDIIDRLSGRNVVRGSKVYPFNKADYSIGQVISLRSPIYCESKKICHTCYGDLLKIHKTPFVGVVAGMSIGERGTQLIMRTFHKGGAATATKRNMVQDIIDGDPTADDKKIPAYINQAENLLVTKKACKITIDMDNYEINDNMKIMENEKTIWVASLLAQIEYNDFAFNIILDYPVELMIYKMQKIGKETIILDYPANETILNVPFTTLEIKEQINYVSRLLGGKEIKKDPEHLLKRLYDVYLMHTDMDLVHFEVLISQVLRDKTDQSIPARLGRRWDPVMMNIKQNVFNTSFYQGLAFENVRKALEVGLTTSREVEPSILERVIKGELIETKKGRRR